MTEPTADTYARQAAGVRAIALVLANYPELATVDIASPVGCHPLAELAATVTPQELLSDARELADEAAYALRNEESNRRVLAAGVVNRAARCTCDHSGINHDRRLTHDGRIPCAVTACRCHDLEYVTQ